MAATGIQSTHGVVPGPVVLTHRNAALRYTEFVFPDETKQDSHVTTVVRVINRLGFDEEFVMQCFHAWFDTFPHVTLAYGRHGAQGSDLRVILDKDPRLSLTKYWDVGVDHKDTRGLMFSLPPGIEQNALTQRLLTRAVGKSLGLYEPYFMYPQSFQKTHGFEHPNRTVSGYYRTFANIRLSDPHSVLEYASVHTGKVGVPSLFDLSALKRLYAAKPVDSTYGRKWYKY